MSRLVRALNAKIYAVKGWKNPFFAAPLEQTIPGRTVLIIGCGCATLFFLASFAYWFFTRPSQFVKQITFEGMRTLSSQNLSATTLAFLSQEKRWGIPETLWWRLDSASVETILKETYPLEKAACTKSEMTLTCAVEEEIQFVPFKSGEKIYLLTKKGIVARETTLDELNQAKLIPAEALYYLLSAHTDALEDGAVVMDPGVVAALAAYKQELEKNVGLTISAFQLTDDPAKVIAQTNQSYTIILNPFLPAQDQAYRYAMVMKEFPESGRPTSYVDIRFHERIYVK